MDSNIFHGSSSEVEFSHVLMSSPLLLSAQVPSLPLFHATSSPSQLNHELDTDISSRLSSSITETETGAEVRETSIVVPNQQTDVGPDNLDSSPTKGTETPIVVPNQRTDVGPENLDSSPTIASETSVVVPNQQTDVEPENLDSSPANQNLMPTNHEL